jgi:hypothetical protein
LNFKYCREQSSDHNESKFYTDKTDDLCTDKSIFIRLIFFTDIILPKPDMNKIQGNRKITQKHESDMVVIKYMPIESSITHKNGEKNKDKGKGLKRFKNI